jgi:hypothetical protein
MLKEDQDLKLVIIGMGYLMEYIMPCYKRIIGEKLSNSVFSVTIDEKDLEGKRQRLGFPVILHDNIGTLLKVRPDIILFAPPPSVALGLIKNVLNPYFNTLRNEKALLPDLYVFPPKPPGKVYLDLLGDDIRVVNILPNMVSKIAGKDLSGEGHTYLTFPLEASWPKENIARLKRFFAPLGGTIEVAPALVTPMLAGTVAVHNISEVILTITDALNSSGHQIVYRDIAGAMRAYHQKKQNYAPAGSYPCSEDQVNPGLLEAFKKVVFHWSRGIKSFYLEAGMTSEKADEILIPLLDLHLHVHQEEPRQIIEQNTCRHATKGGVLEKGNLIFAERIAPKIKEGFSKFPVWTPTAEWAEWLEAESRQLTAMVSKHGMTLANKKPGPFTVENHALLAALLAKYAIIIAKGRGEDAIKAGVTRYGRERGGRMAKRARKNGDLPTMLNYMAYGEWRPVPGTMEITTVQKDPVYITRVTLCPWCEIWKKHGLLQYGKYYCQSVDQNLVKGFDEALNLGIEALQSWGEPYCEFVWNGVAFTREAEKTLSDKIQALGNSGIMSWEYHTGHLFTTIGAELIRLLGDEGKKVIEAAKDDFSRLFDTDATLLLEDLATRDYIELP